MAHILIYGAKMTHGHDENEPHDHNQAEETHLATEGRKTSLADKAKDLIHDVAEMTMDLAQEVKDKFVSHVTHRDISNAAQKVADLKCKLAFEQQKLKEIRRAAEFGEHTLNHHEYEALKTKELRTKNEERETERELAEAEGDYIRLQSVQLTQKHAQINANK